MFFLKDLPTRETLERYHEQFPAMQVDVIFEAIGLMKKGSVLIRALDEYFSAHGLSQLRYLIMVVIHREPDKQDMTATELTDKLDVSKPVMARTLKSLQDDGYITINVDEEDRRVKRIALTDKASNTLEAILPGYYETIQNAMQQLEENDE